MKLAPAFAKFFLLIVGLVAFYFLGIGLVSGPWEGDSLAYHLPLANQLSQWQFSHYDNLLFYYPASVHAWLATFIKIGLPVQWFNVIGWVLLFAASFWLGKRLELGKNTALIFAATIVFLTPLARLITTQTVDIYFALIYVLLLAHLLKIESKLHYFIRLGLLTGALVGAKYTGPLYLLVLLPFFTWPVLKVASVLKVIIVFLLTINIGGIWYLRNWLVMGDPIYPAHHPSFAWVNWQTWQTIFQVPGGWFYFLESLASEYLFWPLVFFGLLYLFMRKKLTSLESKLAFLAFGNLIVHLLTPTSINNVLSDLRYTVPTFICLLGALFLVAERQKQQLQLFLGCAISILASFTLIMPHRPKVFVLYTTFVGLGWLIWSWFQKTKAKRKL